MKVCICQADEKFNYGVPTNGSYCLYSAKSLYLLFLIEFSNADISRLLYWVNLKNIPKNLMDC